MVSVKLQNGEVVDVESNNLMEIHERILRDSAPEEAPAALYVNGNLQSPRDTIYCDVTVRPVPINTLYGAHVVRRSLVHLFSAAAAQVCPEIHFTLRHTDGYSWYFVQRPAAAVSAAGFDAETCVAPSGPCTDGQIAKIEAEMRRLVEADSPLKDAYCSYEDAVALFESRSASATLALLKYRTDATVRLVELNGHRELYTGTVVPTAALCGVFKLHQGAEGLCLEYPHHNTPLHLSGDDGTDTQPWATNKTLVRTHAEHSAWAEHLGIESVGGVNHYISTGREKQLIQLCDLNQERYIADIANAVPHPTRLVLIAGPSSSGKTTFARKLSVHLRCRGFDPVYLSGDDFFVNREDTPRHPDGSFDFEAVEAVDLPYLNDFLARLTAGEELAAPTFDFKLGRRVFKPGRTIRLSAHGVIVLEGIHCLNPVTTTQVTEPKFKIFISPIASMAVSDRHRLSTSDNRMVRRMVRDFKYRGFSASSTLALWESVRLGEDRHIYRFQNEADAVMNSGLNYELAVLRQQAVPLLRSIAPSDPGYADARRVLALLEEFHTIDENMVPNTSILQEFIGCNYIFSK